MVMPFDEELDPITGKPRKKKLPYSVDTTINQPKSYLPSIVAPKETLIPKLTPIPVQTPPSKLPTPKSPEAEGLLRNLYPELFDVTRGYNIKETDLLPTAIKTLQSTAVDDTESFLKDLQDRNVPDYGIKNLLNLIGVSEPQADDITRDLSASRVEKAREDKIFQNLFPGQKKEAILAPENADQIANILQKVGRNPDTEDFMRIVGFTGDEIDELLSTRKQIMDIGGVRKLVTVNPDGSITDETGAIIKTPLTEVPQLPAVPTTDQFVEQYFKEKGWDSDRKKLVFAEDYTALQEYDQRLTEASDKYREQYGTTNWLRSGAAELVSLVASEYWSKKYIQPTPEEPTGLEKGFAALDVLAFTPFGIIIKPFRTLFKGAKFVDKAWNATKIAERIEIVKASGLDEAVAKKAAKELSDVEIKSLSEGLGKANQAVKKVKPTTPVTPKAPWQMTREEYYAQPPFNAQNFRNEGGQALKARMHKDQIIKALSEGKPVPPEVLKDYPDLQAKAAPAAPAKPAPSPEIPISPVGKTTPKVETPTPKIEQPPVAEGVNPIDEALNKFGKTLSEPKTAEVLSAQSEVWAKDRAVRSAKFAELLAKEQASGVDAKTAIERATAAFKGEYARTSTGLTLPDEVRDAAYNKIIKVISDDATIPAGMKSFEISSTKTALDNALAGNPIPSIAGIKGGSAKSRLLKIFDSNPEIKKIIENPEATVKRLLESMKSATGVDDATAEYLRNLPSMGKKGTLGIEEPLFQPIQKVLGDKPVEIVPSVTKTAKELAQDKLDLILGLKGKPKGVTQQVVFPEEPLLNPVQRPLMPQEPSTFKASPFKTQKERDQYTLDLTLELMGKPKGAAQVVFPPDKYIKAFSMLPPSNRQRVINTLKTIGINIVDALGIPKAVKFAFDMSGMSRQLGILGARAPIDWIKTWKPYLNAMKSDKIALEVNSLILTEPEGMQAIHKLGLDITSIKRGASYWERPETMASGLAEKYIPGVRMSNRGMAVATNYLLVQRGKAAVRLLDKMGAGAEEYKAMGSLLNELVGRGEMPNVLKGTAGDILNKLLSSPRYTASRFEWPTKLFSSSKAVRQEAWSTLFSWVGVNTAILGMAVAAGKGLIEGDPRSSDVIKLRIGDKHIDLWQGGAQILRMFAQLGPYVDEDGKVDWTQGSRVTAAGKVIPVSRADILTRFMQSKESPGVGAIVSLLTGKDYVGKKIDFSSLSGWGSFVKDTLAPASLEEVWDAYNQEGLSSAAISTVGLTGVGVNTYPSPTETNLRERGIYNGEDQLPTVLSKELERLNVTIGAVQSKIDDVKLTDAEKEKYQTDAGKIIRKDLEKLMLSPDYWIATDEERNKMIDKATTDARAWATTKMHEQIWSNAPTDKRIAAMQENLKKADTQLGKTISETPALSHEPPDIYDLKTELDTSYRTLFKDIPQESLKGVKLPPTAESWFTKEKAKTASSVLPNKSLIDIKPSKEDKTTFEDYYLQWQKRGQIIDERKLEEFDEEYPNANLGNMTRRQLDLLRTYNKFDKAGQETFLQGLGESDKKLLTANAYTDWLRSNPKDNAQLAFWGDANLLTKDAYNEYKNLVNKLDVVDSALPKMTTPPEGSVDNYFKYQEMVAENKNSSWEAQLMMAQDTKLRDFLGLKPSDTPIKSLELKVKNADIQREYDALNDKESPDYLSDVKDTSGKSPRDLTQEKMRKDNPKWVDDLRRIEAIENNGEAVAEKYVEYGKTVDEFAASSSEAKLFRVDNPDLEKWGTERKNGWEPIDQTRIPIWRIDVAFKDKDKAYQDILDTNKDDIRKRDELTAKYLQSDSTYRIARRQREFYEINQTDKSDVLRDKYVTLKELPTKGFRQERYLLENPDIEVILTDPAIMGNSVRDKVKPEDVPDVKYDEITEAYQEDFDTWDAYADGTSELYIPDQDARKVARDALTFTVVAKTYSGVKTVNKEMTEFGLADARREAYKNFVPETYPNKNAKTNPIDDYVAWKKLQSEGKPKDWADRSGTDRWYEDDWFMQEHRDFYKEVYMNPKNNNGVQREPWDFRKKPQTREIFTQYLGYVNTPEGTARVDYRWNLWSNGKTGLEDWMVEAGIVQEHIKDKKRREMLTPTEKAKESIWEQGQDWKKRLNEIEEILAGVK